MALLFYKTFVCLCARTYLDDEGLFLSLWLRIEAKLFSGIIATSPNNFGYLLRNIFDVLTLSVVV